MPRKMSEEREKEFEELSKFLEYAWTELSGMELSDKRHPSNVLIKISDQYGKSKALVGLKDAINDIIDMSKDLEIEKVKSLDKKLTSKGIVSLSKLRTRYWAKYRAILKRGKIKNKTEYYLVKGIISDVSSNIPEQEIDLLAGYISEFEGNA